jgi:NAD(P)-dependent dehydrogenase (short-subunit alcohol dehydrogenase family)
MRLEGRRIVITGAADGIGASIATLFSKEGARVVAVDLQGERLRHLCEEHDGIVGLVLDVTESDAPQKIMQAAMSEMNGLDVLVNNAGISSASVTPVRDTGDEFLRRVMSVNFEATFRISRAAIPLIEQSSCGRIINTGSILSEFGLPGQAAYTASKHAVAGLTRTLSAEVGGRGITVNFIMPGFIITRMTEGLNDSATAKEYWLKKTALGRFGQPRDIANAALFLASDEASFITGQGIAVDGGITNWI